MGFAGFWIILAVDDTDLTLCKLERGRGKGVAKADDGPVDCAKVCTVLLVLDPGLSGSRDWAKFEGEGENVDSFFTCFAVRAR